MHGWVSVDWKEVETGCLGTFPAALYMESGSWNGGGYGGWDFKWEMSGVKGVDGRAEDGGGTWICSRMWREELALWREVKVLVHLLASQRRKEHFFYTDNSRGVSRRNYASTKTACKALNWLPTVVDGFRPSMHLRCSLGRSCWKEVESLHACLSVPSFFLYDARTDRTV